MLDKQDRVLLVFALSFCVACDAHATMCCTCGVLLYGTNTAVAKSWLLLLVINLQPCRGILAWYWVYVYTRTRSTVTFVLALYGCTGGKTVDHSHRDHAAAVRAAA
jgi:hypothetical protein